jgi:cell division protein FtsB
MKVMSFLFVFLFAILLLVAGCGDTSQARLEQQQAVVAQAQKTSTGLEAQLEQLQTAVDNLEAALQDPCITPEISAEAQELLEKTIAAMSDIKGKKVLADRQLSIYKAELDKIILNADGQATIGDEVTAVGAGITATSPFIPQPWGAVVGLAGTLIGIVGTIMSKMSKKKEQETAVHLDTSETITSNLIASVSALLKQLPKTNEEAPLLLEAAKGVLDKVQDTATKEKVAVLKVAAKTAA